MKSLDLFRSGFNTYEISQKLHKPEHEVSRAIYMARCNENGLEIRTQKSPIKVVKKSKYDWETYDLGYLDAMEKKYGWGIWE